MLQPRRRPLHALLAAAVAAAAVAVACLPGAAAQQVSPLEGQGKPNNSTTTVWFSMYLDRLISGGAACRAPPPPLPAHRSDRCQRRNALPLCACPATPLPRSG